MRLQRILLLSMVTLSGSLSLSSNVQAQYAFDIVARSGANLGDGTPVGIILGDGGVALNNLGIAAFHGRFGPGGLTSAVMTQAGIVAKQGGTLADATSVGIVLVDGGVSINDAGIVAFTGRVGPSNGPDAVMTQNAILAQVGGTLGNGTPLTLIFGVGTEGLNSSGKTAFTGRIDQSFATAILTQDGEVVKPNDTLGDGTKVGLILGGTSQNDAGKIAFLGRVDTGGGIDAIMTQDGVLAKVGDPLGDGRTLGIILSGTSLNNNGDVEFIGRVGTGGGNSAIMTQHGVLVESGDTLPDGHKAFVLEIVSGTVINDNGLAAFQGRLGSFAGPGALFTQNGLVIPVGGPLGGGFTFGGFLSNEDSNKGIAINDQGQIAFLAFVKNGNNLCSAVVIATPLTVPEPSGIVLFGFGAAVLGAIRLRPGARVEKSKDSV